MAYGIMFIVLGTAMLFTFLHSKFKLKNDPIHSAMHQCDMEDAKIMWFVCYAMALVCIILDPK